MCESVEKLLTPLPTRVVRRMTVGALIASTALFMYQLPETDELGRDHIFSGVQRLLGRMLTVPISEEEEAKIREKQRLRDDGR